MTYRVAAAEESGLPESSVDLVTVGQALHWFDTKRFFDEVSRVLVTGGVVAAWCYELCRVSPDCDRIVGRLYTDIVGPYWPPERRLIEERYAAIGFPGTELAAPGIAMKARWRVEDMLGYLRTWSACHRYRREQGRDPVELIGAELRAAWGTASRTVCWPLTVRVARL